MSSTSHPWEGTEEIADLLPRAHAIYMAIEPKLLEAAGRMSGGRPGGLGWVCFDWEWDLSGWVLGTTILNYGRESSTAH